VAAASVVVGTVVAAGAAADADDAGFVRGKAPMTASAPFRSLLLAILLLAPAGRALPTDPPASTLPPLLPSSSVGAVLLKRSALELTPEQVKQLEQVQARLVRDQAAAREAAAHPPEPSGPANAPPPPKATGAGGGGPGPGMSGGKTRPPPNIRSSGADQSLALEQRLDELDTEAFLKAVELLPEAQREKAVDVASRYREQLFEQREREKKR
jgi:hypothetical protein